MKKVLNLLQRSGAAAKFCRGTNSRSFSACRCLVPIVNSNVLESHVWSRNSPSSVIQHRLLSDFPSTQSETKETYVFKLSRLPFKDQDQLIESLLRKVKITPIAVYPLYLYHNLDFLNGDAFIEVESAEEARRAEELQGYRLNDRPVQVFLEHQRDWKKVVEQQTWVDPFLRLSGSREKQLTDDDIKLMFQDFKFGSKGILRYQGLQQNTSSSAYLHLADLNEAKRALDYSISNRVARVFKINWLEVQHRLKVTDHRVDMRGLPFGSTNRDILEFFAPVKPVSIFYNYQQKMPSSCAVYFENQEDLRNALKKNLHNMGNRFVELKIRMN